MGVILSGPRSKQAYLKDQSQKARKQALQARRMGDDDEAERLENVAQRADEAALNSKIQYEDATNR
jgi:hypothetical protein